MNYSRSLSLPNIDVLEERNIDKKIDYYSKKWKKVQSCVAQKGLHSILNLQNK